MSRSSSRRLVVRSFFCFAACFPIPACNSNHRLAELTRENQTLREELQRREHLTKQCDIDLATARQQLIQTQKLDPDRPADLFAPVSLEITSLSGGSNFDDKPGDDGVVVYLRPKDADGQVVKVPGRITVQLLDNSDMALPKVIAVCEFEKPDELRKLWMGILGTNHYRIRCPFSSSFALPSSNRIQINASFVDFLTGRTLTSSREVSFSQAGSTN